MPNKPTPYTPQELDAARTLVDNLQEWFQTNYIPEGAPSADWYRGRAAAIQEIIQYLRVHYTQPWDGEL